MSSLVVVTGADESLGWHIAVAAHSAGLPVPVRVRQSDLEGNASVVDAIDGADRVIYLADVNEGDNKHPRDGYAKAAKALASALRSCATPPKTVVVASSLAAEEGTPRSSAQATAAQVIAEATQWSGSTFVNERLPHVFGEHVRPSDDHVVATFCHALASGRIPRVCEHRELELAHAHDVAVRLLGGPRAATAYRTVDEIAQQLGRFATVYRSGGIPDLTDWFDLRLFNTYRSCCFPAHYPLALPRYDDGRGRHTEVVKAHGSGGQTFCSTIRPGATRGDQYHLTRVERVVVLSGEADIRLRRLLDDTVIRFQVSGGQLAAVDIPTMWTHNITNVGTDELVTLFWHNELVDPTSPDIYLEKVVLPAHGPTTAAGHAAKEAGGVRL